MSESQINSKDILLASVSFFIILIVAVLVLLFAAVLFTFGSPILLLGLILGLGVWGIVVIFILLVSLITVWYVIYALMKHYLSGESSKEPEKGNYTIDRIRKTG